MPYLGSLLLKKPDHVQDITHEDQVQQQEMFDSASYNTFRKAVSWCVQYRCITIGATLLIFALGIVGMGKVQQHFF